MKDNDIQKLIIRFGEYEKSIIYPINYNALQEKIMSLFNIPIEKKSQLIINYKNKIGDITKISNEEEYAEFLKKISEKELSNIILISFHQILQNKIQKYNEDIYDIDEEEDKDKDEISLREGHIFMINKKQHSEFNRGGFDINKIVNENIDEKNNENNENNINENIFKNKIIKSVLPSVASFPTYCNICEKFPIMRTMYFCKECQLIMCEDCEKKLGYNHRHTYYKIRNNYQYQEAMNMQFGNEDKIIKKEIKEEKGKEKEKKKDKTRMDKLKEKKEGINGIFNSIIGFMKGSQDDNNKK